MLAVTEAQLRAAAPRGDPAIIAAMARDSARVFAKYGLTNLNRVWGFLSTALEESGFKPVAENLNYTDAARLTKIWPKRFPTLASAEPYVRNPERLANYVYGGREGNTRPGDGWLYRGRGPIQTTFLNNYAYVEKVTGLPVVANPDLVLAPEHFLECAVALFVRFNNILAYCDAQNWRAVWAEVGSGRPDGQLVNPEAHAAALARVKAAIPALVIDAKPAPVVPTPAKPNPLPNVVQAPEKPASGGLWATIRGWFSRAT